MCTFEHIRVDSNLKKLYSWVVTSIIAVMQDIYAFVVFWSTTLISTVPYKAIIYSTKWNKKNTYFSKVQCNFSNYHFQSSEVSAIIQQQRRLSLISIFYCFASSFLFLLKTSSEYSFVKTEQKWWCLQKCDINQVGILFRRNSPASNGIKYI